MSAPVTTEARVAAARIAARRGDWSSVTRYGRGLLTDPGVAAEGHFLLGLAHAASGRDDAAARSFSRSLDADPGRYDAAVERAALQQRKQRHGDAVAIITAHEALLSGSPYYLDKAGTILQRAGLPARALPLFERARALQPGASTVAAHLAECLTFNGRLDEARELYRELIERHPQHARNHYELARLTTATDFVHIDQMRGIISASDRTDQHHIYLFYALGKELEDLGVWDDAFEYFEMGGEAAAQVGRYDVRADLALLEAAIDSVANGQTAATVAPPPAAGYERDSREIFLAGLPRFGSTLVERMLASHSLVESAGESFFVPLTLRRLCNDAPTMSAQVLHQAASIDPGLIAAGYRESIDYRLTGQPMYIEKLPENFIYFDLLARAFPDAALVQVRRGAMDTALALFKQSYFRYAYRLSDLAQYLVLHDALARQLATALGDRLLVVDYESIVHSQEAETRRLLDAVGVDFEPQCLAFETLPTATNTASAIQVREPLHARGVGRWKHFEKQLAPVAAALTDAGVPLD